MTKKYITEWKEWVELCKSYNEDPCGICELDIGYANSPYVDMTVEYLGEYPEKEVSDE